ncbi:hypothetical protein PR048_022753 [Dryococelus australis]|uniref:Uncharacterized protein n=1 Tax=Dryococelus australis TaxID=614101 RepID=A0ABQ9GS76_9NEOP|nr:hypothetical protein PR048_022753 [Dryococelus australis]
MKGRVGVATQRSCRVSCLENAVFTLLSCRDIIVEAECCSSKIRLHHEDSMAAPWSGDIWAALNVEVLRADDGESNAGIQGRGGREIPEKTLIRKSGLGGGVASVGGEQSNHSVTVARNVNMTHQGELGSIPGGVASGVSHVIVMPDDAAGRRVFSAISRVPPPLYSGAASRSLPERLNLGPLSRTKLSDQRPRMQPLITWSTNALDTTLSRLGLPTEGRKTKATSGKSPSTKVAGRQMISRPCNSREHEPWRNLLRTILLPPGITGFYSWRVRPRIFACGNRAGRCRSLANILGDLSSPSPLPTLHSGADPSSLRFTLICSQGLDVKSPLHYFTHSLTHSDFVIEMSTPVNYRGTCKEPLLQTVDRTSQARSPAFYNCFPFKKPFWLSRGQRAGEVSPSKRNLSAELGHSARLHLRSDSIHRVQYTQCDENSALQLRALLLEARAHLMRLAMLPLSPPRVSASDVEKAPAGG